MKILELFSGTGSVGKVCKAKGYDVVSLDLILPADIKADILTWDYKTAYPIGHFDLITASPVCLWWSLLRLCNLGKILKAHPEGPFTREMYENDINVYGKPMLRKVIEIINYFKPSYYWIENPQTGRMKDFLINLPYHDVDYCKYADWGYKKRTRFWTNITKFTPRLCKKDCNSIENGIHKKCLGGGKVITPTGEKVILNSKALRDKYRHQGIKCKSDASYGTTRNDRYRIPPSLISDLLEGCDMTLEPAIINLVNPFDKKKVY